MQELNHSGVRLIRIRRNGEVPDYYTEISSKEGYSATSGVFRYGKDYWAIAGRPDDKSYTSSYKKTTYDLPYQKFAERDMIEIYPIQLQKDDDPDEWVIYTNSCAQERFSTMKQRLCRFRCTWRQSCRSICWRCRKSI